MAPRIFEERAIETLFSMDNCFEKAKPEKKSGTVSIAGTIIFWAAELNPE